MQSKWFHLKSTAVSFRKAGRSIRDIETSLSIPRSTLSGWFKDINLTPLQSKKLKKKHQESLMSARKKAILWHNEQKLGRLKSAEQEADRILQKINATPEIKELSLAFLYLGEGFKKSLRTGLGNSDPMIVKFFLRLMVDLYKIDIKKMGFELHLRADQNSNQIKKYWAEELQVPFDKFTSVSIDKRTVGSKTYSDYKGVCVINCGNIAIQRRLMYIARKFCNSITEMRG